MGAMSNLSPDQFIAEHVGFDRWAKGEYEKNQAEHEVSPGHVSYPREVGRRQAHLASARTYLEDHYSPNVHALGYGKTRQEYAEHLGLPLHEVLPFHTDLVDEYRNRGKQG
jgi:hypothetical protein